MKGFICKVLPCLTFIAGCTVAGAVERYVSLDGGHVPPFTDWVSAATNIQAAIDAATDGDVIWVTNGTYATGGKVLAGDLTNRVALDKALTVRSVNGPSVTAIQGPGPTNGLQAVRCAWVTNGATLIGFTLECGATRLGGDPATLASGGGVWCAGSNAIIANCVIRSNAAGTYGGGAYQGLLNNCFLIANKANFGAGSYNGVLNSCTVISNSGWGVYGSPPPLARSTNCIVYFNTSGNYSGGTFAYCCTTPLPSGMGNISVPPQVLPDGFHLANTSPCRGAGTNLVSGTDIDGQAWANPPSIGCDEWQPAPLIFGQPKIQLTSDPVGFTIGVPVVGQEPFTCWWTRDGVPIENDGHYSSAHTTNLVASGVNSIDGGSYQVVVSNAFGVATSAVAQLVIHYADAAGTGPVPPYLSWASASTNIQDAINVALSGEIVLVTNGVYATGGKVMGGDLTNRVALDKAIIVQSVNGPDTTIIQGFWNPTVTNGPTAVRCAWLTNGAVLSGFTLRGGATRASASDPQVSGGGVWGSSSNAVVFNCVIATNLAFFNGGGAYQATLRDCTVTGNQAVGSGMPGAGAGGAGSGGGASRCNLINCVVTGNVAVQGHGGGLSLCNAKNSALTKNSSSMNGGAANSGTLINCTITGNTSSGYSSGYGAAVYGASLTNCIVWGNFSRTSYPNTNYANCTLAYCTTAPLATGTGNIAVDPLLLGDGVHLSQASPCRGAGAIIAMGMDIDGQAWASPPSIGCDEWLPGPVIGSQPVARLYGSPVSLTFGGVIVAGQETFAFTWFKNGVVLDDGLHLNGTRTTNLTVYGFGPADAGNYQIVASNAFGVATSAVVQLVVRCVDAANVSPAAPYLDWSTAATNIQDAIDTAATGEIVLVTNGVYSTGGKVMVGDLTNRVALDKALTVISVNGAPATVIQGAWDPATTNGPLAVRCSWLTDGATSSGFTLRNGATRSTGVTTTLRSGGGVWCASSNAVVAKCWLTGNVASDSGGGAYQGTLENCVLTNNSAFFGGGASFGILNNCLVILNEALNSGGGAYRATLNNCTVIFNYTCLSCGTFTGAGTYSGVTRNSIVLYNTVGRNGIQYANYWLPEAQYSYSCTSPSQPGFPMPGGVGNINAFNASPQILDWFHIASTSPCRGAGNPLYATGTDLDGEPWTNPPSIGCDEVVEANLVGPLTVAILAPRTNLLVNHFASFGAQITGRIARYEWSFGDGSSATFSGSHMWTNVGDYTVTLTAYNTEHPGGVSTNLLIHVLPPNQPLLQSAAMTTNGFQFEFPGQESVQYWVEMTTSLTLPISWRTQQTIFFSTGGVHQITDSMPTNASRFYRVKAR